VKSKRNPLGLRGKWTWYFNHSECRCGCPQEVYPITFRSSLKNRKTVAFAQDRRPPERLSGIFKTASSKKHRFLPPYNKESGIIEGNYWILSTGKRFVLCKGEHDKKPGKKGRLLIPDVVWEPERIIKSELWGSWRSDQLSNGQYTHGGMWYLERDPLFSWEQEWFQRTTIVTAFVALAASFAVLLDYGIKVVSWIWQFDG